MKCFIQIISILAVSVCIPSCLCGMYWGDLITESNGRGKPRKYCKTEEGLKIFRGSVVTFKDSCFTCTCDKNGLLCKHSHNILLLKPAGCTRVLDGCEPLLVDSQNEFLRCISRTPTNQEETRVRFILS